MRLDEIGRKYRTDKSSLSNDYLVQYEKLFTNRNAVKVVAEIGVQRGGRWKKHANHVTPSLAMWAEWFPNALIYGMDIKTFPNYDEPRITLIYGDQSIEHDLLHFSDLIGKADLILDDGSHLPEHQLGSFLYLKDNIRPGGYYIIEDCRASVTQSYPMNKRIHALLEKTDLSDWDQSWGYSNVSGPESTKILRRR